MHESHARRAVFFDRDGVLNDPVAEAGKPFRPPFSLAELRVRQGAVDRLAALRSVGYVLVVVTNQPDIGRGAVRQEVVETINRRLVDELGLDALYMCCHEGDERCTCRKPFPGLLFEAAEEHGIDLRRSWLIGDRWVDIAAGTAAGVRTVLLEHPRSWKPTSSGIAPDGLLPEARFQTLTACVDYILDRSSPGWG